MPLMDHSDRSNADKTGFERNDIIHSPQRRNNADSCHDDAEQCHDGRHLARESDLEVRGQGDSDHSHHRTDKDDRCRGILIPERHQNSFKAGWKIRVN